MDNLYTLKSIIAIALVLLGGYGFFKYQETVFDQKLGILQKEISSLNDKVKEIMGETSNNTLSLKEVLQRQKVREKSQDDLLTEAVAKVSPSVVSIVISKNVPQLEVSYENPFGNDPFFKDFGVRVPVYRQKGTVNKKIGAGTGFLITKDGYILTNKHVVADMVATYTVLLSDGSQKPAEVFYRDPLNDIAVIKINGTYTPVLFGDSKSLKPGQTVIVIGNALGEYNNSVSVGIISGLDRTIEAGDSQGNRVFLKGVVQTDAAINPGNSGGPMLSMDGKVLGVNVATVVGSSNISFAIPINSVLEILRSALKLRF